MRVRPSYLQGYARSAGESEHPQLWRGLIFSSSPALGNTGANLFDIGRRKLTGVLTNMDIDARWGIGEDGPFLNFDGVNDRVFFGRPVFNTTDAAQPHSLFVKFRTTDTSGGLVSQFEDTGDTARYALWANGDLKHWKATTLADSVTTINDGAWHTGGFRKRGAGTNETDVFVDGVIEDAGTDPRVFEDAQLSYASFGTSASLPYAGDISVVHIWNRELTASEIMLLHFDPLAPVRLRAKTLALAVSAPVVVPSMNSWYQPAFQLTVPKPTMVPSGSL